MSDRHPASAIEGSASRRGRVERTYSFIDLGNEAPLEPAGLSGAHIDRHGVSLRWLIGSVLTGLSGTALIGAAIYVSLQGDTTFAELPETVAFPTHQAEADRGQNEARRGDKLVKTLAVVGAKQPFKAPMSLRVGSREVIKVRSLVRFASNLSLTSGTYATDIPPFNPQKLFADDSDEPDHTVEPAPETADADVSVVKRDLGSPAVSDQAPSLSDDEAAAQVAEEAQRNPSSAGAGLPLPPQLMLSRSLGQASDVAALAYANSDAAIDTPFSGLDVRVIPENVTVLPKQDADPKAGPVEERLVVMKKGETLDQILAANGANADQIKQIVAALGGASKVSALGEGQQVRILVAPKLSGTEREIVRVTLSDDRSIQAMAAITDQGSFVPVSLPQDEIAGKAPNAAKPNEDGEEDEEDDGTGTRLYESLYETSLKNEVPRPIIEDLVRIFASDVDFQHRVAAGDSVEVLYTEPDESEGSRPELLFASLNVGGEMRRVYRYQSPDDNGVDYFDEDGRSLKKFLLRKPIAEGIMRSGFGMRYHPILHYSKMHTGVDWANKIGTPILAAGDGIVIKAGWSSGYGRHTEIQHANGYVTTYSHQSAFARGIKPGARVRQGQVIGYLGATGLATGPHLHYEVLVNGHFVNPLKIKLPRSRELDGPALAEFKRQRNQVQELLAKAPNSTQVAQRP